MTKYCKRCDTTKSVSEFSKEAARKDGLAHYCRQCNSQASKEWRKKNPDKRKKNATAWKEKNPDYLKEWIEKNPDKRKEQREREKLRRYGMTIEDYNKMLEEQNYACALCGGVNKTGKALSVDHDHSCCAGEKSCGKCVRKLLCIKCNFGIGNFQDNPAFLREAAEYIENHRQDHRQ